MKCKGNGTKETLEHSHLKSDKKWENEVSTGQPLLGVGELSEKLREMLDRRGKAVRVEWDWCSSAGVAVTSVLTRQHFVGLLCKNVLWH